jgi:hypothetical protein
MGHQLQQRKKQESTNLSTTHSAKNRNTKGVYLQDNRPSSVAQRKLVSAMENYSPVQRKPNKTGLPDNLKSGIEHLSGYSMDDVKVHYNSNKPAQLNAHAYAQGTDIHLASGQEKHLPHEAWHVVQQKQGRVQPTMQLKNKININDDDGLEREADVIGDQIFQKKVPKNSNFSSALGNKTIQRVIRWKIESEDADFMKREGLTPKDGKIRIVKEIKRIYNPEDRTTRYPPSLESYASSCQKVSIEHQNAYKDVVKEALCIEKNKTTTQGKLQIQNLIRTLWLRKLGSLPTATPQNQDAFTTDQISETLIHGMYTHASLRLNGRKVFSAKNKNGRHAEEYIIDVLNNDENWNKWFQEGIITDDSGAQLIIIINNLPCYKNHNNCNVGCSGKLVELMKGLKTKNPNISLTVRFANAYGSKTQGFERSVNDMRKGGIKVESFDAANLLIEKKFEFMNHPKNPLTEEQFNNNVAKRRNKDSTTKAHLEHLE